MMSFDTARGIRVGGGRVGRGSIVFLMIWGMLGGDGTVRAAATMDDPAPWAVPSRKVHLKNPVSASESTISRGRSLYEEHCLACHGKAGRGDGRMAGDLEVATTDLTTPALWAHTDGELFWQITKGRRPMPGYRRQMSEKERWRVVHYIRTLAPKPKVVPARFEVSEGHRKAISKVVQAYLKGQEALARDDGEGAGKAGEALSASVEALSALDAAKMPKGVDRAWEGGVKKLAKSIDTWMKSEDMEGQRRGFGEISYWLSDFVRQFGHAQSSPLFLFSLPQTDEEPLIWLQSGDTPTNPYGSSSSDHPPIVVKKFGSRYWRGS